MANARTLREKNPLCLHRTLPAAGKGDREEKTNLLYPDTRNA